MPHQSLDVDGFAVVRGVFSPEEMTSMLSRVPEVESAGTRTMLRTAWAQGLATDRRVLALVESHLGVPVRCVRGILFDKTAETNWTLGLHQDTKIAVRTRHDVEGYGNWSVKEGIVHVQPPVEMLEASLSVRIHLDECPVERGPLRVVPGSHRGGSAEAGPKQEASAVDLPCAAGDVILMRPLLLHGSKAATEPGHRRVLHLEFCAEALPEPLEWAF